jgi:uncharacterized protein YjbI with pentapeptide repeats
MEESKNLKNIFLYKIHFNNSIDLVDKLKHINFSGSELTKMSFHGTSILDVNFTNSLLYRVGFTKTTLERVGFINPQRFSLIDFWGATLVKYQNPNYEKEEGEYKTVNFTGTPLESIPYEKITEPWFSWKLTTPWVVKK